jgi:hypothetical protein
MGGYPSNAVPARTVLRAPNPATEAMVGSIDAAYGRSMQGQSGAIRIGERAGRAFGGDGGILQRFLGGAGLGSARPKTSGNRSLPSTHAPTSSGNRMLNLLEVTTSR